MRFYFIGGAVVLSFALASNAAFDVYDFDGPLDDWEEWPELSQDWLHDDVPDNDRLHHH